MKTMSLTVNGEALDAAVETVADVLRWRGIDPAQQGVAVAVNDAVVPRTGWEQTEIQQGDRVEIITAMQGG